MKKSSGKIQFANTGAKAEACVGFTNEISIGADGWAQIAPFGDFPSFAVLPQPDGSCKRLQAIQRIDKACATQMVNEFQAARKGVKKFFSGRPIYIGHPDVPGIGAKYPDKSAKGVIADLAVREDGLYGMPVFTNEGSDLVEQKKLRYFSGRLADCEEGEAVNGTPVFRPNLFISVGLTNQPHLPVQMLNEADEAESTNKKNTMKKSILEKIIGLCAAAGIELANTADEAAVEAALSKLDPTKVKDGLAFANEKTSLQTAHEAALTKVKTDAALAATTAATEAAKLKTSFANERAARIATLVETAITAGKITAAEKPVWETRLAVEANFANEAEALTKLAGKVKTTSITLDRGGRKVELANAAERREMLAELVNEEMATNKLDYDRAFAKVQKNFPALFEAMDKPEVPGKKK